MALDPKRKLVLLGAAFALAVLWMATREPAALEPSPRIATQGGPVPGDEPSDARLTPPPIPSVQLRVPATTQERLEPLDFYRGAGLELAGRVLNEGPWPSEHLAVFVKGWRYPGRLLGGQCDPDGRFWISGLPQPRTGIRRTEDYLLEVRHIRSGATFPGRLGAAVHAAPGGADVELRVETPARVRFAAHDAATDRPITDVEAKLWMWKADFYQEGRFTLAGDGLLRAQVANAMTLEPLSVGRSGALVGLEIEAAGYQAHVVVPRRVSPGERVDLGRLNLQPAIPISVRVVCNTTGDAVPDAQVALTVDGLDAYADPTVDPRAQIERTTALLSASHQVQFERARHEWRGRDGTYETSVTDADGRAHFTLRRPLEHVLWATHEDYLGSLEVRFHRSAPGDELELRLRRGATVEILATEANGDPMEGVAIEAEQVEETYAQEAAWHAPWKADLMTGRNGSVLCTRLPPGLYRFQARDRSEAGMRSPLFGPDRLVSVLEGADLSLSFVAPPRRAIAGEITRGGVPVPQALVRLISADDVDRVRLTNEQGEFHFGRLLRSHGTVRVEHASDERVVERPYQLHFETERISIDLQED